MNANFSKLIACKLNVFMLGSSSGQDSGPLRCKHGFESHTEVRLLTIFANVEDCGSKRRKYNGVSYSTGSRGTAVSRREGARSEYANLRCMLQH